MAKFVNIRLHQFLSETQIKKTKPYTAITQQNWIPDQMETVNPTSTNFGTVPTTCYLQTDFCNRVPTDMPRRGSQVDEAKATALGTIHKAQSSLIGGEQAERKFSILPSANYRASNDINSTIVLKIADTLIYCLHHPTAHHQHKGIKKRKRP